VSEPVRHLAERRQVSMQPDLEFRSRDTPVFVGDVKYKIAKDARARSGDYYQLLAYTTALDLREGVLIYCLVEGETPERSVTVRHAGKVLHTRAIDLSGSPANVAAEIDALAAWVSAWASSAEREGRPLRLAAS
jgi:5-methylcytosine-specific restriction enzyme subunit McrC